MHSDLRLSGENGVVCHYNQDFQVVSVHPDPVSAMNEVLIEGVKEVAKGELVLLEDLDQEREEGPLNGGDLASFPNEALDRQHDVIFELDLAGVHHKLKERLHCFLNGISIVTHKGIYLSDHSDNIPALVDHNVVLFSLLMTHLQFNQYPLHNRINERNDTLAECVPVVLDEVLQEAKVHLVLDLWGALLVEDGNEAGEVRLQTRDKVFVRDNGVQGVH